jgi:hypothetical protein
MNNEKENIFFEKINIESIELFDKCIAIIDLDHTIKEIFYYFLYNDLISINKNNISNFKNIDIKSIIEDPSYNLRENLENIKSKINYQYINEFKKSILIKQNEVKKKILECDNHINIIKKIYYNMYIEKFLPINSKDNADFENKSVLFINDDNNQYKLGLFFAKIIFSLIKVKDQKKNENNDSLLKSYTDDFFNIKNYNQNYLDDSKKNITDFKNIDINFRYWIILVFITGQLFNKNSKYTYIFNNKNFEDHINKLSILEKSEKKTEKKKEKNKKQKKKSGGGKSDEKKDTSKKNNSKKDTGKKTEKKKGTLNPKLFYEVVLKNCFVNESETLYDIYYYNFKENMKEYFIKELDNQFSIYHKTEMDSDNILLQNPFDTNKEKLKLNMYTDFKNKKVEKDNIKIVFNNLKYNIFNFLKIYLNSENIKITNIFLLEVKKYIVLLLFYLYNLKKKIYKEYLKITTEVFNISNNNKQKNNNKKSSEDKKSIEDKQSIENKKSIEDKQSIEDKKSIEDKQSIEYKKSNNSSLDNEIKKIENTIETLKSKKNISNYHDKILKLENNIKQLIIKKYSKR